MSLTCPHDRAFLCFVEWKELPVEEVDNTLRFWNDEGVRGRPGGCVWRGSAHEGALAVVIVGSEEGIDNLICTLARLASASGPGSVGLLPVLYCAPSSDCIFGKKADGAQRPPTHMNELEEVYDCREYISSWPVDG